ncbi:unnamed protein product [Heligmosomoides polygyrus]|uniref:Glyco_hydro_1 domain-containing protein n=1 Tax=Heligmosomoides polygyrus TaxID=6339 RepID=A0A3P7TNN9_HELPZ|nr:unnamed protein product [Heligmosomoides polygyrus]
MIYQFQVTHYRLSICWTRILPSGVIDIVNEKGVHFYRSLLSELRKNGIEPIVEYWITFNEIFMHAWSAVSRFEGHPHHSPDTVEYSTPKRRIPYLAAHNMLRAHAKVYRMYEREFRATQRGRIGIVAGGQWFLAVSDDPSDTAACQRAVEWGLNWMIEPVFGQNGDYPEAMKQAMNASEDEQGFELLPKFSKTEKEELKGQSR